MCQILLFCRVESEGKLEFNLVLAGWILSAKNASVAGIGKLTLVQTPNTRPFAGGAWRR